VIKSLINITVELQETYNEKLIIEENKKFCPKSHVLSALAKLSLIV